MGLSRWGQRVWNIGREAGASVLTYKLYPLGVWGESLPTLPFSLREPAGSDVPILFLHGMFHNRATFAWLKQCLRGRGWQRFRDLNLPTNTKSIPAMAEQTAREVERLRDYWGVKQFDIVAHSLGGIVARYYVQLLGGERRIRHLITLGSPHQGTELSRFARHPTIRELSTGSRTLWQLNDSPLLTRTMGISIYGDLDIWMRPKACAHWHGARNFPLKGVGHAGLLFSRRVLEIISCHLGRTIDASGLHKRAV